MEVDLCSFCTDLVSPKSTQHCAGQVSHHPTYGALRSSSKTCAICDTIASLWPRENIMSERWSQPSEDIIGTYTVHLAWKRTGEVPSEVSWALLEVSLRSTTSPIRWVTYLTIVTYLPGRVSLMNLYARKHASRY